MHHNVRALLAAYSCVPQRQGSVRPVVFTDERSHQTSLRVLAFLRLGPWTSPASGLKLKSWAEVPGLLEPLERYLEGTACFQFQRIPSTVRSGLMPVWNSGKLSNLEGSYPSHATRGLHLKSSEVSVVFSPPTYLVPPT